MEETENNTDADIKHTTIPKEGRITFLNTHLRPQDNRMMDSKDKCNAVMEGLTRHWEAFDVTDERIGTSKSEEKHRTRAQAAPPPRVLTPHPTI